MIIHNTGSPHTYTVQSKKALTNADWQFETDVPAVEGQDWTPADVLTGDRTNALFFRARSNGDDDGDGLPDWWELENGLDPNTPDTGDTGVSDGYKDGDNDGWSNLQEYQNGTSPGGFNTPPAPQGVSVRLNPNGPGAVVTWMPGGSAVTEYVVDEFGGALFTSTTSTIIDPGATLPSGFYDHRDVPQYRVMIQYPGGNSSWSDFVLLQEAINPVEVRIVPGPGGSPVLIARDLPADAAAVRIWDSSASTNVTVPVNPVDGSDVVSLPGWVNEGGINWSFQQVVRSNGIVTSVEYTEGLGVGNRVFWDGRLQLLQSLSYQLRAADWSLPFEVTSNTATIAYYPNYWDYSDDYVVSSYYDPYGFSYFPDEFKPCRDNHRFRNFCYAPLPIINSSGALSTGVYEDLYDWLLFLEEPATFQFVDPASSTDTVLSSAESRWIYQFPTQSSHRNREEWAGIEH